MPSDKKADEYPKLSEDDKRWKQQDEFDSAGVQRQLEDEDTNTSIEQSTTSSADNGEEQKSNASSGASGEAARRDREQP